MFSFDSSVRLAAAVGEWPPGLKVLPAAIVIAEYSWRCRVSLPLCSCLASVTSYVTCWERRRRRVVPCKPLRLSGGTQALLLPYAFSLKGGNVELFFLGSQPGFYVSHFFSSIYWWLKSALSEPKHQCWVKVFSSLLSVHFLYMPLFYTLLDAVTEEQFFGLKRQN